MASFAFSIASRAAAASSSGTVSEIATVSSTVEVFCTIMSMFAPEEATTSNSSAALPGTSGTSTTVILPSLRRSEEHTSELQSRGHLVCRLLREKKNERQRDGLQRFHYLERRCGRPHDAGDTQPPQSPPPHGSRPLRHLPQAVDRLVEDCMYRLR